MEAGEKSLINQKIHYDVLGNPLPPSGSGKPTPSYSGPDYVGDSALARSACNQAKVLDLVVISQKGGWKASVDIGNGHASQQFGATEAEAICRALLIAFGIDP